MEKILYATNRGIDLSSGIFFDVIDGNLSPEDTDRIVKSCIMYEL